MQDPFKICEEIGILKDGVAVSLVNGRHRFAALPALHAAGTLYPCQKTSLQTSLKRRQNVKTMSFRKIIFYSRSCKNLAELVLPDQHYLGTLRHLTAFEATFQIMYGFLSIDGKTADTVQDLLMSIFAPEASFVNCMQHVRTAKFVLASSMWFE